jgi:hypothetical protein
MMRAVLIVLVFLIGVALAACGRTMPTSPITACPPVAANFVRTDTLYFAQGYLPDGTPAPKIIAYFVDIYACNGADVGQRRP